MNQSRVKIKINLILRVKAIIRNKEEVIKFVNAIATELEKYTTILDYYFRQYWKIPEYYDIGIGLQPKNNPNQIFDRIMALTTGWHFPDKDLLGLDNKKLFNKDIATLTNNWDFIEENLLESNCECIWNNAPNTKFLSPKIKWAQLTLSYDPIIPYKPKFSFIERVRLTNLASQKDKEDPELQTLIGKRGTIAGVEARFEGMYLYTVDYWHHGPVDPYQQHWEIELESMGSLDEYGATAPSRMVTLYDEKRKGHLVDDVHYWPITTFDEDFEHPYTKSSLIFQTVDFWHSENTE